MINLDFNSSDAIYEAFPDETHCLTHLEQLRWNGLVVSPFDSYSKVYACKNNRYRCRNTGKYFNAKTDTIFHNSRLSLQKWFVAIWIVSNTKKITSVQLAKDLELTQKTAWFMLQKIKKYLDYEVKAQKNIKLSVVVKGQKTIRGHEKQKLAVTEWLKLLKK